MPHYDAITSTESGMNPCQTGVWWERFAFSANDQGEEGCSGIRNVASPLSLIALSENFIRLLIRTSPEKITHAMRRLRPDFQPSLHSGRLLVGRLS
jgi:hypothetical protein